MAREENNGLAETMQQVEDIRTSGNHITGMLSYADLIQLGGYCAVEYCGGPVMEFKMGRVDAESDSDIAPTDRLPVVEGGPPALRTVFNRMGFND